MKNYLSLAVYTLFFCCSLSAQNKTFRYGLTIGGAINHYNGNLGNSFFQFKTTCFAGITSNFGVYMNRSLDLNIGLAAGHFGYCQTEVDAARVVALEYRCPGCTDRLGMGDLRSLMVSGSMAVKYKFANGYLLNENARLAPYVYAGMGINHLSDNMKKQCVNVGNHFSLNAGAGIQYNINKRFHVGYNLGIGCFVSKKVYDSGSDEHSVHEDDGQDHEEELKMERRKDFIMQNALTIGFNF